MKKQLDLANCILAINSILLISKSMPINKVMLIYPLLYQKSMLSALSNKKNKYISLERIIIDHPEWISNFNNIYYSTISISINAVQYMYEMDYIKFDNGDVVLKKEIEYDKKMGDVVKKYYLSSSCISNLLRKPSDYLYLNLRIIL